MKRSVNINSNEWCDVIFKNKNRSYGAYELRQSSAKRHLIAIGVVVLLMLAVMFIPTLMAKASEMKNQNIHVDDGTRTLIEINKEDPIEEEPLEISTSMPEPPKFKAEDFLNTIANVEPVIGKDEDVPDDLEVHLTEDVIADDRAIGVIDWNLGTDVRDAEIIQEEDEITEGGDAGAGGNGPVHFAEVQPQYPGGDAELLKYLKDNINYPTVDAEIGRQGRVVLQFVVTATGDIEDVKVISGLSSTCDREAVRVVSKMKKWIPGKQNGRSVAVYFNLPVVFKLM